jgi:hypothetical protein
MVKETKADLQPGEENPETKKSPVLLVVLVILGILGFLAYIFRDNLKAMWSKKVNEALTS